MEGGVIYNLKHISEILVGAVGAGDGETIGVNIISGGGSAGGGKKRVAIGEAEINAAIHPLLIFGYCPGGGQQREVWRSILVMLQWHRAHLRGNTMLWRCCRYCRIL